LRAEEEQERQELIDDGLADRDDWHTEGSFSAAEPACGVMAPDGSYPWGDCIEDDGTGRPFGGGGGASNSRWSRSESCTFWEIVQGECDDASGEAVAAAAAIARRANPWLFAAAGGWQAYVQIMKTAGEKAVQNIIHLDKNTRIIRDTFSGRARIPDFWDETAGIIYEVKNTYSLSLNSQIRDMAHWADDNAHRLIVYHRMDVMPSIAQARWAEEWGVIFRSFVP